MTHSYRYMYIHISMYIYIQLLVCLFLLSCTVCPLVDVWHDSFIYVCPFLFFTAYRFLFTGNQAMISSEKRPIWSQKQKRAHTHEWVYFTRIWMSHVRHIWMSHVRHIWMSHVTHIWMSHVTHIWMSHFTHIYTRYHCLPLSYRVTWLIHKYTCIYIYLNISLFNFS